MMEKERGSGTSWRTKDDHMWQHGACVPHRKRLPDAIDIECMDGIKNLYYDMTER